MHDKKLVASDSDEMSDSEENPLIDEVFVRKHSTSNMKNKALLIFIVFLVLLSFHILLFNNLNVKVYNRREVSGWSLNTSRATIDYILPNENTTLIDPPTICREDPILLLIVVCSSASNFEARQSIRESWGNTSEFNYAMFEKMHGSHNESFLTPNNREADWRRYVEISDSHASGQTLNLSNFRIRVVFLLGLTSDDQQYQINYEHEQFGDIIQENFIDSYNNLTLKSVFMLKWANRNCVNKIKYIMKCDDDSFVNVPNLIHVLLGGTLPVYKATILFYDKQSVNAKNPKNRLAENKFLLLGYKFCSAKPISDVQSKWYAPNYLFAGEFYPDYLSGTAYVMSFDAAQRLYKGSLQTPLFHLEDVYLTGFVAEKIKLKRQHHQLFYYLTRQDHCSLRGMLTQHQMTPMTIEMAYTFVTNLTIPCGVPEKNFMSVKLKLTQRKRCQ